MKKTAMDYLKEAKKISADVDGGRWALAGIARDMREDKIDHWAAKLAALPNVRRAERTVMAWAATADFSSSLRRKFNLPFSFFSAASNYADRIELTDIEDALETWEAAEGGTIESFGAFLRDLAGVEPPDMAHTLRELTRLHDKLGEIALREKMPASVYYGLEGAQEALQPALDALEGILMASVMNSPMSDDDYRAAGWLTPDEETEGVTA